MYQDKCVSTVTNYISVELINLIFFALKSALDNEIIKLSEQKNSDLKT